MDVRSVNPEKYNNSLAGALKNAGNFNKPEWIDFVKTSSHKARPNVDADFWYKRAASVLRQIYVNRVVGVQRLRTRYGGRKDNGVKPATFVKGSGNIIRKILQQADVAGLTEKSIGVRKGRQLTQKGKEFLEKVAGETK